MGRAPEPGREPMDLVLSADEARARSEFRAFAEAVVAPCADEIDRAERIPPALIRSLGESGYLGAGLPREYGGLEQDPIIHGLLHEELGRASAAVQGLVNVQHMAAQPIARWANEVVRRRWLPALARGERIAAFAVTEPNVGSDAKSVETTAAPDGGGCVLQGRKRWITCAQIADVFVVLCRCAGRPTAFLVERERAGLQTWPIRELIGCRGYMLAEVSFEACRIPGENLLAGVGFGLTHAVATGLEAGRYALAWGCVGVAQACLDAALSYADQRHQFGARLAEHELVQQMISRMITRVRAARLLCFHAGQMRRGRAADAVLDTAIAKYFSSTQLREVARDAVQIHGANGCSRAYPVERYLRDATIMEIIEGTTQVQEILIAQHAMRGKRAAQAVSRPNGHAGTPRAALSGAE